jgi:hypothetical protein
MADGKLFHLLKDSGTRALETVGLVMLRTGFAVTHPHSLSMMVNKWDKLAIWRETSIQSNTTQPL